MVSDNRWGQIFVINNLSLKLKIILIVSLLTVDAWSSQLTQLADLKDSSCKEALSKNVDDENSEIDGSVKKYKNVRIEKSEQTEYLKNEFNKISPSHLRSDRGYIYPHNARDVAVRLVIELEGNVSRAARALGVSQSTVRNWALDYQDRTGKQIINTKKHVEYSHEFISKAIKQVEKTNGDVLTVSKQLNILSGTLTRWLVKYELESSVGLKIIDPFSGNLMDFEDKMLAAMIVDEDYKGNVRRAAEDLGYIPQILNVWVWVYEEEIGKQVRKKITRTRLFDEERSLALEVLKEEKGSVRKTAELLDVNRKTLSNMDESHYNETGERNRNTNPNTGNRYDDDTKAYAVKIVIEHKGNVLAATRQLNEEGINVSKQAVREWVIKHEQETGKKILNTNYDDKTKAHVVEMVKKHGGNVTLAMRELEKEGFVGSKRTVYNWWNKYKRTTEGKRWWNEYKQTTEGNH